MLCYVILREALYHRNGRRPQNQRLPRSRVVLYSSTVKKPRLCR